MESNTTQLDLLVGEADEMSDKHQTPVLGPYSFFYECAGLNVHGCHRKTPLNALKSTIRWVFAILLSGLFLFKTLLLYEFDPPPLGLEWADSNVQSGLYGYAFVCSIALILWSKSDFIGIFQTRLNKLRQYKGSSHLLPSSTHVTLCIFVFCILLCYVYTSMQYIFFPMAIPSNQSDINQIIYFSGRNVTWRTFYGLEPVVVGLMGVVVSTTHIVFYLVNFYINLEMKLFNKDLRRHAEEQTLTTPEKFEQLSRRHRELFVWMHEAASHLNKFMHFGSCFAVLATINSLYIIIHYRYNTTNAYYMLQLFGNTLFFWILGEAFGRPSKVQEKIDETLSILAEDEDLNLSTDPKITHHLKQFVFRCERRHYMTMAGAYRVDRYLVHKVVLIVTIIGIMMAIVEKLVLRNEINKIV